MSVDLERVNIAGKVDKYWILDIKKTSVEVHLHAFGAKAGLEHLIKQLYLNSFCI